MQNNPFANQLPPQGSPIMNRGQLRVKSMIIQKTGTYHNVVHRPIFPMIEQYDLANIANRAAETAQNGMEITAGLMSGLIARSFAPPAEHSGVVAIPNGWSNQRLRFLMEIEYTLSTGANGSYFIQGYSDHPGVHYNGIGQAFFDEHMPWFMNSYLRTQNKQSYGVNGIEYRAVVIESAHVVGDDFSITDHVTGSVYKMRPQDIITGMMAVDTVGSSVGMFSEVYGGNHNPMSDPRASIHHSNNTLRAGSIPCSRSNDIPTVYASKILNSISQASANLDIGMGAGTLYSRARTNVYEPSLTENVFIRTLSVVTGRPVATWFSIAELTSIDANATNAITYIPLDERAPVQPHSVVGSGTCAWSAATNEAVMATVLASAIPSLMLQNFMTVGGFSITNDTPDRRMRFVLIVEPIFLSNLELSHMIPQFIHRLESEVMFDLCYGGEQTYAVSFIGDVFGETHISVSIDGGTLTPFVTPSFADGKLTSLITPNQGTYHATIQQFAGIVDHMRPAMTGAAPGHIGGI